MGGLFYSIQCPPHPSLFCNNMTFPLFLHWLFRAILYLFIAFENLQGRGSRFHAQSPVQFLTVPLAAIVPHSPLCTRLCQELSERMFRKTKTHCLQASIPKLWVSAAEQGRDCRMKLTSKVCVSFSFSHLHSAGPAYSNVLYSTVTKASLLLFQVSMPPFTGLATCTPKTCLGGISASGCLPALSKQMLLVITKIHLGG